MLQEQTLQCELVKEGEEQPGAGYRWRQHLAAVAEAELSQLWDIQQVDEAFIRDGLAAIQGYAGKVVEQAQL